MNIFFMVSLSFKKKVWLCGRKKKDMTMKIKVNLCSFRKTCLTLRSWLPVTPFDNSICKTSFLLRYPGLVGADQEGRKNDKKQQENITRGQRMSSASALLQVTATPIWRLFAEQCRSGWAIPLRQGQPRSSDLLNKSIGLESKFKDPLAGTSNERSLFEVRNRRRSLKRPAGQSSFHLDHVRSSRFLSKA